MNFSSGVTLGQLLFAVFVMAIGMAVAWGGLLQRVKTLEVQVAGLLKFGERIARLEEGVSSANSKLDQLVGSWLLRDAATYEYPARARRPTKSDD